MRSAIRQEGGSSLVEFALVTPILLLLLVGIFDVGRAVNAYVTLANAAREGSRYAALHPTADPETIASAVRARVEPLDPDSVIVELSYHDGDGFRPWPAGGVPPSSPSPCSVPTQVRVAYPWQAVSSLIGALMSATELSASSVMDTVR